MSLEVGKRYGEYELIDTIDRSKSRHIFRVRNHQRERFETLQVLPSGTSDDPERLQRFQREVRILAQLVHENIPAFYNSVALDGQVGITTEPVEAVSLRERLELGPLPHEQVVEFASQTLRAVQAAHGVGVVHREVTPANILLTPEGTVKLAGFASAKGAHDHTLTQVGSFVGESTYMSPEQVRGGALDGRTDLYAMGVVIYEMLTGRPPFVLNSQFDVMLAHVNVQPDPPSKHAPVNPAWDRIVLKALEKDSSQRYQDAAEMIADLESLGHERNERAPVATAEPEPIHHQVTPAPSALPPAPPRQRVFLTVAIIFCTVLLATLAIQSLVAR